MYVCLCKGITDTQIRAAVADGASSLREVHNTLVNHRGFVAEQGNKRSSKNDQEHPGRRANHQA